MTRPTGLRAAALAVLTALLLAPAAGAATTPPDAPGAGASPSVVEAFREDWESASTLEAAGWTQEVLAGDDPIFRRIHRTKDDARPDAPIPASSPPHLVTTMGPDGSYTGPADARLASPVLDLRYVRGTSASTSQVHDHRAVAPYLGDAERSYQDNRPRQYLFHAGYHRLLPEPPSEWFPLPCPHGAPQDPCTIPAEGYDQADEDAEGGEAYDRYRQPIPPVESPYLLEGFPLVGDAGCPGVNVFGFFVGQCLPEQSVPVPGTRSVGLYADDEGRVHAPNPVDRREGAGHLNLTFWHAWDLDDGDAAFLEVRHRRADGTWSPWRVLQPDTNPRNRPHDDPTAPGPKATVHLDDSERTITAYERGPSNRTAGPYNGWFGNHRAWTGSSGGLVSSTFDLSRFAGTRIQLALRQVSVSPADEAGWFVDDVAVSTDTYPRDVGVRRIDRPGAGDRIAPDEAFHPAATVRNYGHEPVEDVTVTFEVASADGETLHWRDEQMVEALAPQEQVQVASLEAFDPQAHLPDDPTGAYRVRVNVTPFQVQADPAQASASDRPQTTRHSGNDARSLPLQVQAVPQADVAVDVADGSVQTDVGESKTFDVGLENTGNTPLSGAVEVTATRLNRTTREPAAPPETVATATVDPGELPHGDNLTLLGVEENTWTRTFTWQDPDPHGVYRLQASFRPEVGPFRGQAPTYVRATPPSPYQEEATPEPASPFSDRSVHSAGMRVDAWNASIRTSGTDGALVTAEPTLPDPVSPTHVWYARGDDGEVDLGDRQAEAANDAADEAARTAGEPVEDRTFLPVPDPPEVRVPGPDSQERTRDTNYVDHYWLTRELNLTAHDDPGTRLVLTFWHHGTFNWTGRTASDQPQADHARGRVEILPSDQAYLAKPHPDTPGVDSGPPEAETGVDPVDDRTPSSGPNATLVGGDALYAQPLETWTSPVPLTKERLDLTPWKGENVTLRFHLETAASRRSVNGSGNDPLPPWIVDNVQLSAKADGEGRTVFRTDVEGDDWKRWSTADGVRLADPRSPVAVVRNPTDQVVDPATEGRGWERYAYGDTTLPSGWHVTDDRIRPSADGGRVASSMFRWGDPAAIDDELPANVNLSILRTPEISLQNTRDPVLTFRHNYTFPNPPGLTTPSYPQKDVYPHSQRSHTGEGHVLAGGSVWIVGENDEGEVVKRDLLVPAGQSETTYDAVVANWYTGSEETCRPDRQRSTVPLASGPLDPAEVQEPGGNELHCGTPLRDYPYQNLSKRVSSGPPAKIRKVGGNVFANRSGVAPDALGSSQWERAAFDLSPYAEPGNASLDYHIEFHAINQRTDKPEALGWLVDDIQITERTLANDVGVAAIRTPGRGDPVGPGLNVTIAADVANRGLYAQAGIAVQATVLGPDRDIVYGPEVVHTNASDPIPGLRSGDPGVRTVAFPNWTAPQQEGEYRIRVEAVLEDALEGHAFPDRNASNDLLVEPVEVREVHDVALADAGEAPARRVVRPYIASPDRNRTFAIPVQNVGTMPQDPALEVAVHRDGNRTFHASRDLAELPPRTTRTVAFRDAWSPDDPGPYAATFRLHADEDVHDAADDNRRRVAGPVPRELLPGANTTLEEALAPSDANWTHADGAWRFGAGGPYPNGSDSRLRANATLDLGTLEQALVRLDHMYAFEEAYDGGRLEVRPNGSTEWIPVPPRTGLGPDAQARYPVRMVPGSPLREDPRSPSRAWSGQGPEGDVQVHDLADVPALTERSRIFHDTMANATLAGEGRPDSPRYGNWSTTYLSRVTPHSGDKMFRSNDTIVVPECWRFFYENSAGSDEEACRVDRYYDSRKYLNVTFDDDFPRDRDPLTDRLQDEDVAALRVRFWDYRSIGFPRGGEGTELRTPNEVSLRLTCVGDGCPEDDQVVLDPVEPDGYDDNYRGWTRNTYDVPIAVLQAFNGSETALRISFVHHVLNGNYHETRGTGLHATDAGSLHAGWFVDDVQVELVHDDGNVTTYWSDDIESRNRTFEHGVQSKRPRGGVGRKETLNVGPWSGNSYTMGNPALSVSACNGAGCRMPRLLWDPVSAWGGEAFCTPDGADTEVRCSSLSPSARENASKRHGLWRHVRDGALPCGPLADEELELAQDLRKDKHYPKEYRAEDTHFRACGPTRKHRDRAGDARLVTGLDLRPAVGNVTLELTHEFRFQHREDPLRGRSGGRLEVSVDGGTTWIPLQPVSNDTRPMVGRNETQRTAQLAAHTAFGEDPESNSRYGIGGQAWTGVSGDAITTDGAEPETATYDLSRFAGRKVKLAWHAHFGTHNYTRTIAVDPLKGAYEYWAIREVDVRADVLEAEHVDLRLRAATDATGTDDGWTVDRLDVLGVPRSADPGVEVASPDEGAVIDDENQAAVRLTNDGAQPVTANATLEVLGPHGNTVLVASETGITLEAGASLTRTSLGGEALTFQAQPGDRYRVVAEVTAADPAVWRRQLPHDDRDVVRTGPARPAGQLAVADVDADPNHLDPSTGTGTRVAATVTNRGHGDVELASIEANVSPQDGSGPSLVLDGDDLEADPDRTYDSLGETRTYAWDVPASDLAALDDGLHRVRVDATEADGDVRRNRTPLFLGHSFVEALGYEQEVRGESLSAIDTCRYTNQDAEPEGQRPAPDAPTWEVDEAANRSGNRSFEWLAEGYGTQPYRGGVTCEAPTVSEMGPSLRRNLRFHLWTRYRLPHEDVTFQVRAGTSSECDRGGVKSLPPVPVKGATPVTPSFDEGAFVHRSAPFPDTDADGSGCLAFEVREHVGYDEPHPPPGDAFVDDVVVAPLGVAAGPDAAVPVPDGTTKTFPVVVENRGSFNASLQLALEDEIEEPADGPSSWTVTADPSLTSPLAVPPGGTRLVEVTVSVPEGAADDVDEASVGLAATSGQTPHVRDAAVLELRPTP